MSSSQSEERTMFFTCGKNNTSNRTRKRCFFACEKNYTSSQKSQRCVSFAPKFPLFIGACSLQRRVTSQTFNEKVFLEKFFWSESEKHRGNWSGLVSCFTVDEENCRDPAKQQRQGIHRTWRKLKLRFWSELLLSSVTLKLYSCKSAIFSCVFRTKS